MPKNKHTYAGIDHPSIGHTYCPTCGAIRGTPCRPNQLASGPYCETHRRRIEEYEKDMKKTADAFVKDMYGGADD